MIELPTDDNPVVIIHGDCLDILPQIPSGVVDAVVTDPPYFKVKSNGWDRQWDKPGQFLQWLDGVTEHWHGVLKANGSLYCFASPRMSARVETLIAKRFNVLNNITWQKDDGWSKRQCKEEQRAYFPASESIIFAEHYGADNIVKGEAGYHAKCDDLRGFVFEPLRKYFDDERKRCGISNKQIMDGMAARGVGRYMFARHTFCRSQWQLPTREQYEAARDLFNSHAQSNDYLRREYEDLRRPFSVTKDVPYTDVWSFPTVQAYKGKHPCEKPEAMMVHIVKASTRPGAVILDPFAGSGTTGVAAILEGRKAILIEKDAGYVEVIKKRIAETLGRPTTLANGKTVGRNLFETVA